MTNIGIDGVRRIWLQSPVIKIYEVILNGRQRGATVDLTAV